jgi:hypothetical protein
MKHLLFGTLIICFAFFSCSKKTATEQKLGSVYFGKHITEEGAIDCNELKDKMGESLQMQTKIKGEVVGICPDKTCLLRVDMGDGTCMNVKMNNEQIHIPKDVNGKTVILEGKAYIDTTGVKMLPGYESDSGRSVAETEVTKDPEVTLAFDATGLIIK